MRNSGNVSFSMWMRGKWTKALVCTLVMSLPWLFVWFFPWQERLAEYDRLRLFISLIIFILPGFSIYGLLADRNTHRSNYIPFGFVISHLLVAVIGLAGRFLHFSFESLVNLFMGVGFLGLHLYLLPKIIQGSTVRFDRTSIAEYLPPAVSLLLILMLVSFIVIRREISDDDLTYLAYLTNSQHSTHLDFNDILFGLNQLTSTRFWLMSAPLNQAFLAQLSKIPGVLLLAGYYQPFLVGICMMGWYGLARTLRLSRQSAAISVVLQVLFLLLLSEYLHPGAPFWTQLDADKAAASFIFAPIFIQSENLLLRDPSKRNFILCLLTGLSLTLLHPIALAYAVFIGGMLILLNFDFKEFRASVAPLAILLIILLPQVFLRFAGAQAGENVPYNLDTILSQNGIENMITLWRGTSFYGINLHSLEMRFPYDSRFSLPGSLLKWVWLIIPLGAFFFAIRKFKQSEPARYIVSAFVLCTLVGIPFTGWIVGYFLSAWALERALWLFPFGLSAIFLLLSIREETGLGQQLVMRMKNVESKLKLSNIPLIVSTIVTSAMLLLFMREQGLPDFQSYESNIRRFADIARVGNYLDRHISEQAVVMGSDVLNDLMPGVSSKAKLITFRTSDYFNMALFPVAEIEQRIADRKTIFSETASPDLKVELLRKYDVRFIILTPADRDLFSDLIATYPDLIKMEKVNRFFVVEIMDQ